VRFVPASLGDSTAGSFAFYFDGSDVGLNNSLEDIDAIAIAPDGRLIMSTLDNCNADGISGAQDEDLLIFTATSLGANTAGTFSLYFDGSDVGLSTSSSEDIVGAAVLPGGNLLLATAGAYSVPGLSGGNDDVIRFAPTSLGPTTAGSYSLHRALASLGISSASAIGSIDVRSSAFAKGDSAPGCPADFTYDGAVDSRDFFAFLAEFFAGEEGADINHSGAPDSQDFFDFLTAFFEGCR
jgi:hypothetical protein